MAIDNVQAVRFCNEKVRPLADHFCQLYFELKALQGLWVSQGLGPLIPDDPAEIVIDGSAIDGRSIIDGADVRNIVDQATALIASLEATGNAKLNELMAVAVNPER